jgi:hypothetical protein
MTIPQLIPSTASGPTNNNMTVNISGSGLTPDEIVARAKTAMTSMLEKLKP